MFTRINSPLKKIFRAKKPPIKNRVKKSECPSFYCWHGHFERYENDPEFKYRIVLKKKFSTVKMGPAKIDMIGVGLVGISQLV